MRAKRVVSMAVSVALVLAGCSATENEVEIVTTESSAETQTQENVESSLAKIDTTKWNYNEEDDVYWQVGISYCENPADEEYETLGIFVPGAYMDGVENTDGTYTCEVNTENSIGDYNAETAPIVIPVDTPGYSAMAAPTDYVASTADYTKEGIVYVSAGCRGRDAGAPAGVTDLKAAIRYIRYSEESIPGSTEHIFSFGMSGGGAQSALIGATGDSDLYTPYLEAIGAVSGVSDAVAGSMCWCPITNLDYANEAYEWNLGVSRTGLDEETQKLSDGMAEAFAQYVNELGLQDEEGNVLVLTESEDGIYQAGSYYEYVKQVVENSLNNFLADTVFPYEANTNGKGGFGGGMMRGERPDGELPEGEVKPGRELPEGEMKADEKMPQRELPTDQEPQDITERDDIQRNETEGGLTLSGSYETVQDYIDALNAENEWVIYDSATNTATITSVADFVKALKNASKNVGAFDDLDAIQGENTLFGYGDGNGAHFDPVMAALLADNAVYGQAYADDMERTDEQGNKVAARVNMYNPMYYLEDYYEGYQTSNVAQYWRIRTGINQGDTALTTEINLALALENYGADVDFETVWGQGHVEAERTGSSTENFIAWIHECLN